MPYWKTQRKHVNQKTAIQIAIDLRDCYLTLTMPKLPPYRNQSIDLQNKSIDWILYDGNFGV